MFGKIIPVSKKIEDRYELFGSPDTFAVCRNSSVVLFRSYKLFTLLRQARMRLVTEGTYRELAEKGVAAQAASATSIAAIQADLIEVKTKLLAIEKVLREVE